MTLHEFNSLEENEQMELIWCKGVKIDEKEDDDFFYVFYRLDNLIIEKKITKRDKMLVAFKKEYTYKNIKITWKNIENFSIICGIVGVIISSYFAAVTYYNTEQISKLNSLITQTSRTNDTLVKVINELRQENMHLLQISKGVNSEYKEIKNQTPLFLQQVSFLGKQQQYSSEIEMKKYTADQNRLLIFYNSLLASIPTSPKEAFYWDTSRMISFLRNTKERFESENMNTYLLSNNVLRDNWLATYNDVVQYLNQFYLQFNNEIEGSMGMMKHYKDGRIIILNPQSEGMMNYLKYRFPAMIEKLLKFKDFLYKSLDRTMIPNISSTIFNDDSINIPLKGAIIQYRR